MGKYYSRKGASGFFIPTGSDPYTYLKSLLTYNALGIRIGHLAENVLNAANINITTHSIQAGLSFLQQAAAGQRAHEMAFIEQRVQDLQTLGMNGNEIDNIINNLKDMKDGKIDYKNFIQSLNTVITNIEKYQTRIKAFNTTAISNIPQVRMVEELATTIGSFADQRDQMYYSQEEAVRQLALRWLGTVGKDYLTEQMVAGIAGGENIAAVLAIVTQQMSRYIYDKRKMIERHVSKKDKKGKFADFHSVEEFVDFINDFDIDEFEKYTNMSKILDNDQLLKEVQQMYGISYDSSIQANGRRIRNSASREIRQVKSLIHDEPLLTNNFKDIMRHITVEWHGKRGGRNKLAFENELVSALAPAFGPHLHLGSLNMGTDMLLGYIGIDASYDDDNGEISNALHQISERLHSESAINDTRLSSKIYLEEMQKLNDALSGIREGFIIHETTKNYNTLERGKWPDEMDSFSGREMKLNNYIGAISQMGSITGIDIKNLAIVANNLATDAIGSALKAPFEHFLAIFGGIIMFDDFAIIGKEITEELSFSNIQNIHLYRLQDTYFPASMFLEATFNAFSELENELLEGNGFVATISVPTVNYYINGKPNYAYGEKFAQRWEGVRSFVEKNTSIHLHFAANFLSLMQSLL